MKTSAFCSKSSEGAANGNGANPTAFLCQGSEISTEEEWTYRWPSGPPPEPFGFDVIAFKITCELIGNCKVALQLRSGI